MTDVLKLANESKAGEVVILLDCCFSGLLGNPPTVDNAKVLPAELFAGESARMIACE